MTLQSQINEQLRISIKNLEEMVIIVHTENKAIKERIEKLEEE